MARELLGEAGAAVTGLESCSISCRSCKRVFCVAGSVVFSDVEAGRVCGDVLRSGMYDVLGCGEGGLVVCVDAGGAAVVSEL